ncbi:MAG: AAA family ATPase [Kineosporiaceae bacterium]
MRITELDLRNWRTFKSLDVSIQDRLFILGPNASGKSHFLDSVKFLRDVAGVRGGLQEALAVRGGLSRVRSLHARNNFRGRVYVGVALGDDVTAPRWRYELTLTGERGGRNRPLVEAETVRRDGEIVLERPSRDDKEDPERLTQTSLEQTVANKEFREVAEFLSGVRYLHLVPQIIRDPARASDVVDDPFGGDFIARINRVSPRTRDAWLARVTAALQIAVPQFEKLGVSVDPAGRPHLEAAYTHWRTSPARQNEADLSDGTLRLVGLLWSLVEGGRRSAPVLLEEPELSLHPAVVRQLPSVLQRAQRSSHAQILVTTHSPDMMRDEGIGADEVLILTPTPDGTRAQLLADDTGVMADLEAGVPLADLVVPMSAPPGVRRLARLDPVGA